MIPASNVSEPVQDFFDLVASTRTLKTKFLGYMHPPLDEAPMELSDRILKIRNDLLRQSSYYVSSYPSLSSVFGDLFLPLIISMRAPIAVPEAIEVDTKVQKITRKSPSKLRKKRVKHNSLVVLKQVEDAVGENTRSQRYLNHLLRKGNI